jgi:hypothetical protein
MVGHPFLETSRLKPSPPFFLDLFQRPGKLLWIKLVPFMEQRETVEFCSRRVNLQPFNGFFELIS